MHLYGLISLFSVVNIFNIITSSILLRKREIAELKSLGMSNKQINKMLYFECVFYGLDAIVYGTLISLVILYIMYLAMIDTKLYLFSIPFANILISVMVVYIVIFISMKIAKRKIYKGNIIDEIKEENI